MSSSAPRRCPVLDPTARAAHAEAAALRAEGPAVLVELPGGVRAWSVTRHNVIQALTGDPRVSRDFRQHWPGLADVPEGWPLAPVALQQNFLNAYGTEHHRLRRSVAPSFTPRRVEEMRPQVQATADHLISTLAELPPGESVDLRKALSLPLTITVICDLFGVPDFLRGPLGAAIDAVLDTAADLERGLAIQTELHRLLTRLLRHKESHPGTDLTSDLITGSAADGPPLSEPELLDTFFLMLGAGYETAVNLITSAVHAALTHPEHLGAVRENTIGWGDVIEETLRHQGPVNYLPMRYAVEDIDLGDGVLIRQGDPIIIAFAAAGRDPELHPQNPDEFDPTRASKEHLAFGHGPHFCLGAHLARLEAHIALATLFTRLPHVALAHPEEPPSPVPSFIVNGPSSLHVVPTPAAAGQRE
ncbi:cytochrome P450 family protein [Streptantibioticus silvisoli]|uniref:Cytochrome P450 n=1 Tax=Streptantibioticus silvisoli TaxID=2705255 RepID=A0ABT6W0I7_9ACTN|nr:cytochrome P450 [Streptantibioticus silvisoli]MDI5963769.1 cytochrome P450 [Streptantibioticus silvisoli]